MYKKALYTIVADTIRELVDLANDKSIKKEEIVTINNSNGLYYLIYYR